MPVIFVAFKFVAVALVSVAYTAVRVVKVEVVPLLLEASGTYAPPSTETSN